MLGSCNDHLSEKLRVIRIAETKFVNLPRLDSGCVNRFVRRGGKNLLGDTIGRDINCPVLPLPIDHLIVVVPFPSPVEKGMIEPKWAFNRGGFKACSARSQRSRLAFSAFVLLEAWRACH